MKKTLLFWNLVLLVVISGFLQGCTDSCETTYKMIEYRPVYTQLEDLRSSVELMDPQPINQSGKIYYINEHLLINEPNEGIHIIDNSNPQSPVSKAFINIPGNFDMAAVDGYLYADSYIDLLVFDIKDIANPKMINRVQNVFPNYNSYGFYIDPQNGIVTDWEMVAEFEHFSDECDDGMFFMAEGNLAVRAEMAFDATTAVSPSNPGVGGSMARFTINNDHLYMIDQSQLHVADITDPTTPEFQEGIEVRWGIETIFPYDSLIFIGANDGMLIYDVSSPKAPQHLSTYNHVNSCDPVVTDGKYAYVTLRSGTECQGFTNQLEVLDIQDLRNPKLIETYQMHNPHGLSISDERLFICDGDAGLKVFDASDVTKIDENLIKQYSDIHAFDVIVLDCLIMLIGEDGLRQYSCNDFEENIEYLSTVPFKSGS